MELGYFFDDRDDSVAHSLRAYEQHSTTSIEVADDLLQDVSLHRAQGQNASEIRNWLLAAGEIQIFVLVDEAETVKTVS